MRLLLPAVVVAVAVIAFAGPSADTAHAAPALQIQSYHVVRPGETLFCIGRGYHVNPWSIAWANHLSNPNYLRVGQTLGIPAGAWWYVPGPTCPVQTGTPQPGPQPVCASQHVVQPGQTLYGIALANGVTVAQIAAANGIGNPNYVRAYQSLCIPPAMPSRGPGRHPGGHR